MADKSTIIKGAQKYIEQGQIDLAISELERLAREAPDAGVYNTIGDLYLKKGDRKQAIESFHKSAELSRRGGFIIKAIAIYKKAINIDQSDIKALIALGELSEEKQLMSDAIRYYLSAADSISKKKERNKLIMIYEKILSLSPANIQIYDKVSEIFLKEGIPSNAARGYSYIARLYSDKGDYDKAEEYFKKAVSIQPDNKDALLGLSHMFEKRGEMLQAISYVKEASRVSPDDPDLLLRCALLLKDGGKYDESVYFLSKAIELNPANISARRLMGEIHLLTGNIASAWEAYKTTIDSMITENKIKDAIDIVSNFKDIKPLEAGRFLVRLYRLKGDNDATFKEMIELAGILSENRQYEDAVECYQDALNIKHGDAETLKRLAALRETYSGFPSEAQAGIEAGLYEKESALPEIKTQAEHPYSELLDIFEEFKKDLQREIGEEDSETHYNLGIAYKEMGLVDDAINEFLTSRNDPERFLQSATMLGMCYLEKGLFSQAIDIFRDVLENMETRDASYWEALYSLASAYEGNGNAKEAGRIFREIHSWNPGFRDVVERLNNLEAMLSDGAGSS